MLTCVLPTVAPADEEGGASPSSRWPGRLGAGLIGAGLALIPWLFVLAGGLPSSTTAAHWPIAWVGLDSLEALGLITTGVLVRRRSPRRCPAAAVTATLLFMDAWFDVSTASAGADQAVAVAMALFLEIPIAVLCAVLALRPLPGADSGWSGLRHTRPARSPKPAGSRSVRRKSQPSTGSVTSGARAVRREVASASAPMSGLAMPPTLTVRPRVTPLALPMCSGR